jgi:hypothetical protein
MRRFLGSPVCGTSLAAVGLIRVRIGPFRCPPSHAAEDNELLGGGQRDGGWQAEGRPEGGHALAILPGLTHYNIGVLAGARRCRSVHRPDVAMSAGSVSATSTER